MSAPERIWATSDWRRIDQGKWWDSNPGGDSEEYIRADLAPATPKVKALVEALRWYASQEAWTIDQVEGPHGDYGSKARAAIAAWEGGDA